MNLIYPDLSCDVTQILYFMEKSVFLVRPIGLFFEVI